ncbi:DUF4921 family protein [Candidatus Parcubacteria bacterium]|nr:MAG: DUF4921 family protein [Candidatus Parcubacteria bacterium]
MPWPPHIAYPDLEGWQIVFVANKYPALLPGKTCPVIRQQGIYQSLAGKGRHELVITRDHDKNIAHLTPSLAFQFFFLLQQRYREFRKDPCIKYASTFFNWGPSAGASVYHPHYQLVGLPIIPPDIMHSLDGSRRYFQKSRACVHCVIVNHELKRRTRLVAKAKHALALAPFAPTHHFEVKIFPRRHFPSFEETPEEVIQDVALLLQKVLRRIEENLGDPDLNFYLHTAPLRPRNAYRYYHWHISIAPNIAMDAGFELGTGMQIIHVFPEETPKALRKKK